MEDIDIPAEMLNGIMAQKKLLQSRLGDVSAKVKMKIAEIYKGVESTLLKWFCKLLLHLY
jgi:hypothetical protein